MGRVYYYLAASMPSFNQDGEPPFSLGEFLQQCEKFMHTQDFTFLHMLLTKDEHKAQSSNAVVNAWMGFNNDLRNEIAYFRAKRANKDPHPYLRGERNPGTNAQEIIAQASKAPDPLSAEKVIDKIKWQFLDSLLSGHYFDFEVLLIYGLKLKMLLRYQEITSGRGQEKFEELKKVKIPQLSKA